LRDGVTTEYHHVEALKEAGGKPLTTKYRFLDAALDNGGIGIFETLEVIESIEISLYLIGVSAYARLGEDFGARLCAEAMGTEAVHRALVRFAQGELGKEIGPTTSASRTSTGPRLARSAKPSRHSASATGSKPHSPAGSMNTSATRSPTASALASTTRCQAKPDHRAARGPFPARAAHAKAPSRAKGQNHPGAKDGAGARSAREPIDTDFER
jgi:hypothetical protein